MNKKQLKILSKELCDIFDKYECQMELKLSKDDTQSWMNYKFIRNTTRDFFDNKIKQLEKNNMKIIKQKIMITTDSKKKETSVDKYRWGFKFVKDIYVPLHFPNGTQNQKLFTGNKINKII